MFLLKYQRVFAPIRAPLPPFPPPRLCTPADFSPYLRSLPLCWFALFTYRSNDFVATSTERMRIFSGSSSKGPNPLELRRSATALDGQQDIILRRLFRFALAEDSPFRTLELAQASAGSHVADFCRLSRVGDAPRRFLSAPTCCAGQFMPVGFLTWSNNFFSRF